jgi:hypothetical protein
MDGLITALTGVGILFLAIIVLKLVLIGFVFGFGPMTMARANSRYGLAITVMGICIVASLIGGIFAAAGASIVCVIIVILIGRPPIFDDSGIDVPTLPRGFGQEHIPPKGFYIPPTDYPERTPPQH